MPSTGSACSSCMRNGNLENSLMELGSENVQIRLVIRFLLPAAGAPPCSACTPWVIAKESGRYEHH